MKPRANPRAQLSLGNVSGRTQYDSSGDESDFQPQSDSDFEDASNLSRKRKKAPKALPARNVRPKAVLEAQAISGHPQHSRSSHIISSPAPIRLALLEWFEGVKDTRGMPWRKPFDPSLDPDARAQRAYEASLVWVSEIMLQQTQVATVIPYYNRWMEKFPTINDLAESSIDEVNAVWKGLGYYSRARRLLEGAQKAVSELGGKLPDNAKDMEAKIPGIGRYSAGAICSIAYGEEAPVLDGNVHRLLSRFLALHRPPKAKPTLDILWAAAKALVETGASTRLQGSSVASSSSGTLMAQHAGDINQALIELGSTVCKVREPSCASCPIKPWCAAYGQSENPGSPQALPDIEDACDACEPIPAYEGVVSYPMKADRKKPREELDIVNVIEWRRSPNSKDRHFLFVKRPEGGLLAGLYEFPTNSNVSTGLTPSAKEALGKELVTNLIQDGGMFSPSPTLATKLDVEADTAQSNRVTIAKVVSVGDVIHVFSHIKKTYSVQWLVLEGGICPPALTLRPGTHANPHKGRERKGKARVARVSDQPAQEASPGAMWTHLDDVHSINMGSGVVKVWNLTKNLWEP